MPIRNERFPGGRSRTEAGEGTENNAQPDLSLPPKPVAPVKKTYESQAQIRDLRKEATAKFVPAAVKRKIDATKGAPGGRLLEEDEMQQLESEGYGGAAKGTEQQESLENEADAAALRRLQDEEAAFERELGAISGDEDGVDDKMEVDDAREAVKTPAQKPRAVLVEDVSDDDW